MQDNKQNVSLYYFDARGIAEPIRLILKYGKQEFKDIRIPLSLPPTIPPEVKEKCTWGQLPFVEIDGKKFAQSLAITRYFAKKHNLVPKDDDEAVLCDEYVDACRDFIVPWVPVFTEEDEEVRLTKFAEVQKSSKERFLSVFESRIAANGGKHLVGKSLTWADIYLAHVVSNVKLAFGKCAIEDDFPAIKGLIDNVFNTPGIKEWVEERPSTKF